MLTDINPQEVFRTLEVFKPDNALVEIRIIGKYTASGYFRNSEDVVNAISAYSNDTIYFVFNAINDSCYSREQSNSIVSNKKLITTSDKDITWIDWILIDCDPVRTTGVSASDKEKKLSYVTARNIFRYLRYMGFEEPVVADSGNGYHLMYKVSLSVNDNELVKRFLQSLDIMFSDSNTSIDTSVFNPSRITKLYGTYAHKGKSTQERPHRLSRILSVPDTINATSSHVIERVAQTLPEPEKPSYHNEYGKQQFDLRGFISKHSIAVEKETHTKTGTKLLLEHCVFNPEHKSPDAALFLLDNGAIGYKCFHNSCSDKTWKHVRAFFEPETYDRKHKYQQYELRTQVKPNYADTNIKPDTKPQDENQPYFWTSCIVPDEIRTDIVTIRTGTKRLDDEIIGFNKGEVTVLSGSNGSGKSTLLSQWCLNMGDMGYRVALFSGELKSTRAFQWLYLQAAGKNNTIPSAHKNLFFVENTVKPKIKLWLDDKIYLYNNYYGNKVKGVLDQIKRAIGEHKVDVVALDNLMSLDITSYGIDKYANQTQLILELSEFAKQYNVHVIVVMHPRKPLGFIRKDDISGTADLTNAADNVIICHRVNEDFGIQYKKYFGVYPSDELMEYSNVIEVCKNRDIGIQDMFIGMHYDISCKRLLNTPYENMHYGWEEVPKVMDIPEETIEMPF